MSRLPIQSAWIIPVDVATYHAVRAGQHPYLLTPGLGYTPGDVVQVRPTTHPLSAILTATPATAASATPDDARLAELPTLESPIGAILTRVPGLAPGWCVIGLTAIREIPHVPPTPIDLGGAH